MCYVLSLGGVFVCTRTKLFVFSVRTELVVLRQAQHER